MRSIVPAGISVNGFMMPMTKTVTDIDSPIWKILVVYN